jgi:metal-sulfur cluster biosynthetic enzyme
MNIQPDPKSVVEAIRETLKAVKYPPYSRDIVSFGLVKHIEAADGAVTVELELAAAKPETALQIQAAAEKVLQALPQLSGFQIKIEATSGPKPSEHSNNGEEPRLSPLQDELQHEGAGFDPDPLIAAMMRPDLAPGVGYGEDGPDPLGGPMGDRTTTQWQGQVRVFQWEIDPSNSSGLPYGEHEVERGKWTFRLWWQVHPADLVYASISAIAQEDDGAHSFGRPHPIGRNVAVNLVYDLRRQGIVAIYGTALDFRPFVEVFLEAFNSQKIDLASATSPVKENNS